MRTISPYIVHIYPFAAARGTTTYSYKETRFDDVAKRSIWETYTHTYRTPIDASIGKSRGRTMVGHVQALQPAQTCAAPSAQRYRCGHAETVGPSSTEMGLWWRFSLTVCGRFAKGRGCCSFSPWLIASDPSSNLGGGGANGGGMRIAWTAAATDAMSGRLVGAMVSMEAARAVTLAGA